MKIVIAGYGPVGQAVANVLNEHSGVDISIDDPYKGYEYPADDTVDGVVVCVASPIVTGPYPAITILI